MIQHYFQLIRIFLKISDTNFFKNQLTFPTISAKIISVADKANNFITGCGSAWLERLVWDQEVAGSNPVTPITCGCSSMVEHQPSKLDTWVRFPSPAFFMSKISYIYKTALGTPHIVASKSFSFTSSLYAFHPTRSIHPG